MTRMPMHHSTDTFRLAAMAAPLRLPDSGPDNRRANAVWADRGQCVQIGPGPHQSRVCWAGLSRFGSISLRARAASVWLQIRGNSEVRCEEGQFSLRAGDWLALDADSCPELLGGSAGLTLGLVMPSDLLPPRHDQCLFVGKGRMEIGDLRAALQLWRAALAQPPGADDATLQRALRPLLAHLAAVQERHVASLGRCPGHSRSRRRRVFNRLQRAWLYLEGNTHRMVRMSELAQLTNYSTWYISKAFHELYGESVQTAAARLRIEHARDLLVSTSLDITEVAEACGFDNACSFARAFRARTGTTATEFRRAHPAPSHGSGVGLSSGGGYWFGVLPQPGPRAARDVRTMAAA